MMDNTDNSILRTTFTLNAPIGRVWEAWTKPEQMTQWWGPAGFTSTINVMDVAEGGEWNLTLHGPHGTNYPNRSIYRAIIPQEKIVFEHFNPHFITTILFKANGDVTEVSWSLLFDSPEMYDVIVKAHKADKGQQENIERLREYLE